MAILRAVDGRLVNGGKGKRDIPAGHFRRRGIPLENTAFGQAYEEQTDGWVKGEEVASKENSGMEELQRDYFTADEIEKCRTKLRATRQQKMGSYTNS